ncbi:hypothetical protein IU486_31185 [Streptomyces gardneri]|nr:hypothetical protein [Nocardia abscessus]MBF6169167.1 hypothetical protein [Streptomyces gardneri]MBF6475251.1 hypothetical protein [Nocardia abscessus]
MQGLVGLSITAAVEAVSNGLAGGRWDRCDPAEVGEGRLADQSPRVVADRNHQCRSSVRAECEDVQGFRSDLLEQSMQVSFEQVGLLVCLVDPSGE